MNLLSQFKPHSRDVFTSYIITWAIKHWFIRKKIIIKYKSYIWYKAKTDEMTSEMSESEKIAIRSLYYEELINIDHRDHRKDLNRKREEFAEERERGKI